MPDLYTIGHSNREIEIFIEMLRAFEIEELLDIRSFPGSKKYPHFNKENLSKTLRNRKIGYRHVLQLGGRRRIRKSELEESPWQHPAFASYAVHMKSDEFLQGIEIVKSYVLGKGIRTAVMCSESLPWRCHRRMVADALMAMGWKVHHIMSKTSSKEHTLPPFAQVIRKKVLYLKAE